MSVLETWDGVASVVHKTFIDCVWNKQICNMMEYDIVGNWTIYIYAEQSMMVYLSEQLGLILKLKMHS